MTGQVMTASRLAGKGCCLHAGWPTCCARCCLSPAGPCLCTEASCLTEVGTQECPAPSVPTYSPTPPPANLRRLVLQTGLSITRLDGGVDALYNGTVDAGISTQYSASWNNYQVSGAGALCLGAWLGTVHCSC